MCTDRTHNHGPRFTSADFERMDARLTAAIVGWVHSTNTRVYTVKPADALTLERLAIAAIGCGPDDLRQSELDLIAQRAADYVGRTYRPTAAQWHRITEVGRRQVTA